MIIQAWVILCAAASVYMYTVYSKFRKHGVRHFTPVPLLGNMTRLIFGFEHFAETMQNLYKHFPEERFVGNYEFLSPVILIRDIELIKKVTIEHFSHFRGHQTIIDDYSDPVWAKTIFNLKGDEWKTVRTSLQSELTLAKIRQMLPEILNVGDKMMLSLKTKMLNSDEIIIDCKDFGQKYANDVVAVLAFSMKINSTIDQNNEFFKLLVTASHFGLVQQLKLFCYRSMPTIMKYLTVPLLPMRFYDLMRKTTSDVIGSREGNQSHNIVQKLFNIKDLPSNVVVSQMSIFTTAAMESVPICINFLAHELALNPRIQDRLFNEINENYEKNKGVIDYDSVQKLTYLNMVVSEILRLWSPGPAMERICTEDYNLGKPNETSKQDYIVRKGDGVLIPIAGFHHDPEYFPNPHKFDPERFSAENKGNIKPYTYFPFGIGPRSCPGNNIATFMVKLMVYKLLLEVEILPVNESYTHIELAPASLNLTMKGGHLIKMKRR